MNPKISYFFLGMSALLAAGAVALFIWKPRDNPNKPPLATTNSNPTQTTESIPNSDNANKYDDPSKNTVHPQPIIPSSNPTEILQQIATALEKNDMNTAIKLMNPKVLGIDAITHIKELSQNGKLRPLRSHAIREVGEIELNRLARWAIELEEQNQQRSQILFDMRREGNKWMIEKITLPSNDPNAFPENQGNDPLIAADSFIQAVHIQNFETALRYVDPKLVSDTKIAALCILFEEGKYRIKSQKPLRAMFTRPNAVGYIANVETSDANISGQFALNLNLHTDKWLISEINLDNLLADYANRFADGDIYYSPLVKNPAGGETLALYFEFDEDTMSQRTRRQLEIVAAILKKDPSKKITLSGHTDALGTNAYNDKLSSKRATVVSEFLIEAGVPTSQISIIAKGASQPRRPNVTETGEDDPQGRRANRRTEIYLDF